MICPFCSWREDPKQQALLSLGPVLFLQHQDATPKGTGIIIPVRHAETVFDLTAEESAATVAMLRDVKAWMDDAYRPDGYTVGWNCGSVGGQEVMHAHLHVIPRFADEPYAGRGIRFLLKQTARTVQPATAAEEAPSRRSVSEFDCPDHDVDIRVNVRPAEAELSDLCQSVGWSRFGTDYVALDGYSLTISAWTKDGRLIAWTSVVSDNVRHAFLLDVMVHPAFQKRGIGRTVVLRAIKEMRARGVTAFHVDCALDRATFYEKCGFTMCAGGWLNLA